MLLCTACTQREFTESINPISNTSTISPTYDTPTEISNPTLTNNNDYNNDYQPNPPSSISNGVNHQLPTIQGETITIIENGNVGFDFPQYKGKIIVFEIFGKDCEYCVEEMPIINRIKRDFPNRVKVIAIQGQDRMSPSIASNILHQHNINYPIIEGDDAKEILRFLADTYAWRGILPYILLIKDGTTEYTFPDGGVGYEELRESIETLL
jgi:thiol-disulfide isomerase/thioredoxin